MISRTSLITGALLAPAMLVGAGSAADAQSRSGRPELEASATLRTISNVGPSRALSGQASDVVFSPQLTAGIARNIGRHSISLTSLIGRDFYARNERLGAFRLQFGGLANLAAGPCQVQLAPSFRRNQTDLGSLILVIPAGSQVDLRNIETVTGLSASAGCGQRFGIQPYVSAGVERGTNSNDRRLFSDFNTRTLGGGLRYNSAVVGQVSLGYSTSRTLYPERDARFLSDRFTVSSIELALSRPIGSFLTTRASIARSTVDAQPGVPSFSGLTWSLGLTATPVSRLQLVGQTSRSVRPALRGEGSYGIDTGTQLSAIYALSSRLRTTASWSRTRNDYRGQTAGLLDPVRETRFNRMALGASLTPSQRLRFGAEAGVERRSANDARYDYSNRFVSLTSAFKF